MRIPSATLWTASMVVIVSVVLSADPVFGQGRPEESLLGARGDELERLDRSQAALFDFRLNEAERLLRPVVADAEPLPYGYYLYTSIAFWRAMVEDVPGAYDRFYARSDSLLDRIAGAESHRWLRLIRAEAYLQRAIVLGKTEHFLRAAWAGRKVYNAYTGLVDDHPEFYPTYFGLGLTHVLLGSLPGTYRWVLARFGISGTVDDGLEELEVAAEKSEFNGPHAQATLALIDLILNQEKKQGVMRLRALYDSYPNSLMFAHLYGFALYSTRRAEEAQKVLEVAHQRKNDPAYHFIDFVTYYLAEAYFVQNKFDLAERRYREFLDGYDGKALVALGQLRCGLALEMQGRYSAARTYYERIDTERSFDSDEYARRTARDRLERPMSDVEQELLRGSNAFYAGHYEAAVTTLEPIYNDASRGPVYRARAAFYLGRTMHVQSRFDEALTYYGFAASNPGDRSDRWQPWSQFYIGTIYAETNEPGTARALFEQILSYEHEYSYKKALEQRVHTAMDQL